MVHYSIEQLSKLENLETLNQIEDENELLEIVKSCLKHVIACNFTGYLKFHESTLISEENARIELTRDIIRPCVAFGSCWSLYIIKSILLAEDQKINQNQLEYRLLKLSFLNLWAQALVEKDSWIIEEAEKLIAEIKENLEKEDIEIEKKTRILLEMASIHFLFYQYDKANTLISEASEACNLNVDLSGMLGKRTRYQQKEVAQLVLIYQNNQSINIPIILPSKDVPIDCNLNDDTLLEHVEVGNSEDSEEIEKKVDGRRLSEIQLACLLWAAKHEKATHFADSLVHERCMPFIETVCY
ncbi:unnamed protein product [Caenorhabditis angaria]|uniref:Uncharacterized protein n=1 Tax=Caenorhabditis angaria TaxID=860376 RepID=A0A9P1N1T9_9PELO|nr:unnamed protein product [Caenorhabditis angaria]